MADRRLDGRRSAAAPRLGLGLDYDTTSAPGICPSDALLAAGRFSSTLFLALSVAVMFALGWQFGGRPLGVSRQRALRAQPGDSAQRAAGDAGRLDAVLRAAGDSDRRPDQQTEREKAAPLYLWVALILAGGLTLASKHSGIIFVAGALGWIFVAELARHLARVRWRDLALTAAKLIVSGALMLALFVALSPALWNDPPARIVDLLAARSRTARHSGRVRSTAPTTLAQRIEGIITEPFMTPPQHFEVAFWANFRGDHATMSTAT